MAIYSLCRGLCADGQLKPRLYQSPLPLTEGLDREPSHEDVVLTSESE